MLFCSLPSCEKDFISDAVHAHQNKCANQTFERKSESKGKGNRMRIYLNHFQGLQSHEETRFHVFECLGLFIFDTMLSLIRSHT